MQVSCLAIVVLGLFAAMATSLQPTGSKKIFERKSLSTPEISSESLYNYKIVLRKLELHPQHFGNYLGERSDVRVEMYNDSMPVISGKIELLKDLAANMKIRIIGHRYSVSHQWILTFDLGWHVYCKFAEDNVSFMKNILEGSDLAECPSKKGTYTATNMVIDEKGFPPALPESRFRIDAIFAIDGERMGGVSIYADIVHKDIYDD